MATHLLAESPDCEWVQVLHHLRAAGTSMDLLAQSLIERHVLVLTAALDDPQDEATREQTMTTLTALWDRALPWRSSETPAPRYHDERP